MKVYFRSLGARPTLLAPAIATAQTVSSGGLAGSNIFNRTAVYLAGVKWLAPHNTEEIRS